MEEGLDFAACGGRETGAFGGGDFSSQTRIGLGASPLLNGVLPEFGG